MLLNIDLFTLSCCYQQALADFETSTIQRGLDQTIFYTYPYELQYQKHQLMNICKNLDCHVYIFSELNDIEPYSKRQSFTSNKIIIITNAIRIVFCIELYFVYHGNMLSKHHRDSPPLAKASRWNLSKFVVIKHFG